MSRILETELRFERPKPPTRYCDRAFRVESEAFAESGRARYAVSIMTIFYSSSLT